LTIFLAVIPFFHFMHQGTSDIQGPVFSTSGYRTNIVEITGDNGQAGIYFVAPFMTIKQFLQSIDANIVLDRDFVLENGVSVNFQQSVKKDGIVLGKISAEKKIALGMPLDVNHTSVDELMLVPGLGEATAKKIVQRRQEIGGFTKLEQLMDVNGIKEKKFSKLIRYLYVEKAPN